MALADMADSAELFFGNGCQIAACRLQRLFEEIHKKIHPFVLILSAAELVVRWKSRGI